MTLTKKLTCNLVLIGLLAICFMPKAQADIISSLTVYAGPQSVSPRETIHVTVEFNDESSSIYDGIVELSYISDGILKTLSGTPKFGLISFDVPAQDRAGLMTFSAKAMGITSKEAMVIVVAASPLPFKITAQSTQESQTIKLTSNVIKDSLGNPISDLSLVSMEWIDFNGLKAQQMVQLLNGRISFSAKCPANFTSPLIIRAAVDAIESHSKDVSTNCLEKRG